MKKFFRVIWKGIKKIAPKGSQWFDFAGFVALMFFYAIIPFVIFTETFGGVATAATTTKLSLGMCVGIILIFIVLKKVWLNTKTATLQTRIGIMADNLKVETDDVKKSRLATQIAIKKAIVTAVNLIVPILCILAIIWVAGTIDTRIETAQQYLKNIKQCVNLASTSFLVGVIIQITLPFIKAKVCYKPDKGV